MSIKIIQDRISKNVLEQAAAESFGTMVKAVVDIEDGIMALGGELHADAEAELLQIGSVNENLWGINIYPAQPPADRIEYISLINIRSSQGNQTMEVENQSVRDRIKQIVDKLIE
ncbi:MAG: hypothetical protein A3J07_03825 [Candidatus Doudnabacteria bacterium RIFCSPLOWO2_02_FULL_49_13]|uniref:Uncharacterized protein n=1 Tax=Candidatus Doudnabacteria bacterium RIFCSPHIGHO2_12_FULL_48_16 TaxID=1817838 RepID=A0A1F5PJE2_9BACT|nr:MAG: hypothetical protein A3B77_02635 [Candidatus Doudnabacteria bacterium RIFCSPHIGHO2_02_FULL_49_24]OGE89603.1 MAG: hypothetical protein A2760_03840 [Candidatus Doudnabacteria bacterium RIFCSPHIGHO2_01_FULL_50_67]OGE90046.1 MAG: hypothetical protein A3E29_02970 [Candidatus Doudnabacteria bacterium RIFCSPHIGHO2_12_FULL_48_16]OGE96619.1 MAG: hypothetical protein A2990_00280 [Candidatus Doudnabacteria bacterium RIFCSPLOWO2_01_FULL_49_40]OGF03189.1 MAG: hypothetical protein A3J07_03825 [Candid